MKTSYKIFIHIGFWILFTILPHFFYAFLRHPSDAKRMYMFIIDFGINFTCFYIGYFLFIPKLLRSSKKVIWIIIIVIFVGIYGFISSRIILSAGEMLDMRFFKRFNPLAHYSREFTGTLLFIAYAGFIQMTENWIVDQRLKSELMRQNQASELALLKSQVSPHFLFNTLNNIYSLVYQKSEKAPSVVMKLSEIMRYMLYEASTGKVGLDREIEYLKSYIEIQSIRLKQTNFVNFRMDGTPKGKKISPMLFIPFVENAFKHCDKKVKSPGIEVKLTMLDDRVEFMVRNKKPKERQPVEVPEGGIGLSNVKRRLELLYTSTHRLDIQITETVYSINLIIFEI